MSGGLMATLRGRRWMRAEDIAEIGGLTPRMIRDEVAGSDGQVISGQRGYCLMSEATPEEIRHAAAHLASRARKILVRVEEIRRREQQLNH